MMRSEFTNLFIFSQSCFDTCTGGITKCFEAVTAF
jgi:hypothetical protein